MHKRWLIGFLVFNLVLITLTGISVLRYGTIHRALDVWNGRVIQPDQETKTLIFKKLDKSGEVKFMIKNYGTVNVNVVGCFIGCVGKMIEGPPYVLGPGEERPIRFLLRCAPGDPLDNSLIRINLYTGWKPQQIVPINVQFLRDEKGI